MRMQLELLKPEMAFEEQKVLSTIVVFGGTQIIEEPLARASWPRHSKPRPPIRRTRNRPGPSLGPNACWPNRIITTPHASFPASFRQLARSADCAIT